jgi:nucleoside-diphosphate-sugar epimerase
MFKTAMATSMITVNNPAIWRPILSIRDAADAYIRAIESNEDISGIFNIASGNFTLGEIGDIVRGSMEECFGREIKLAIKHIEDIRNYKVSIEKAQNILSFKPKHNIDSIVKDLAENVEKFKDFENVKYYNIKVFTSLAE